MACGSMTSKERVRAALEHRPPDRPPVWEYFWPQWEDRWLVDKGFADGDIRRAIPMLLEVGVDAIQPTEVRAGMDVNQLKARYGSHLSFIGNIDNTGTLAVGTESDIRRETMAKLPTARQGGYIIGSSHSVGIDVSTSNYEYFRGVVRDFPWSEHC
jgi:uroporphyrinogen-III decarboxylase